MWTAKEGAEVGRFRKLYAGMAQTARYFKASNAKFGLVVS